MSLFRTRRAGSNPKSRPLALLQTGTGCLPELAAAGQSGEKSRVLLFDAQGKKVYETPGNTLTSYEKMVFENTFGPGLPFQEGEEVERCGAGMRVEAFQHDLTTGLRPFPITAVSRPAG